MGKHTIEGRKLSDVTIRPACRLRGDDVALADALERLRRDAEVALANWPADSMELQFVAVVKPLPKMSPEPHEDS